MTVEAVPGNAGRADYPRMIYHEDGRYLIVQNAEQHQAEAEKGFKQTPQEAQLKRPVTSQAATNSLEPLAILVRDALNQVLDERGLTKEWVEVIKRGDPPQLELSKRRT